MQKQTHTKNTNSHVHPTDHKTKKKYRGSKGNGSLKSTPYFTAREMLSFEKMILDKQQEVAYTVLGEKQELMKEPEHDAFGIHGDNGTDEEARNRHVAVLKTQGKLCQPLLEAHKIIRRTLSVLRCLELEKEHEMHPRNAEEIVAIARKHNVFVELGGLYGICRSCHTLIPRQRLEAVPHTTICYNCKTKLGSPKKE